MIEKDIELVTREYAQPLDDDMWNYMQGVGAQHLVVAGASWNVVLNDGTEWRVVFTDMVDCALDATLWAIRLDQGDTRGGAVGLAFYKGGAHG